MQKVREFPRPNSVDKKQASKQVVQQVNLGSRTRSLIMAAVVEVTAEEAAKRARWTCVYPIYMDSTKTLVEGRRIPKAKVCSRVALYRISQIPRPT